MVTNTTVVVCPKCRQGNQYAITHMELIDTDLHVSYLCETCGTEYTNVYTLVYMGGHTNSACYDRDNIAIATQAAAVM